MCNLTIGNVIIVYLVLNFIFIINYFIIFIKILTFKYKKLVKLKKRKKRQIHKRYC